MDQKPGSAHGGSQFSEAKRPRIQAPVVIRTKKKRRRRVPMPPEELAEMEYINELKAQHQQEIFQTRQQLKDTLQVIQKLKQ